MCTAGMHNFFEAKGRIMKHQRRWEHEAPKAPRTRRRRRQERDTEGAEREWEWGEVSPSPAN